MKFYVAIYNVQLRTEAIKLMMMKLATKTKNFDYGKLNANAVMN